MFNSAVPSAPHVASVAASSPAPAAGPTRRAAPTEEFGPFVVAQLDAGTTWAYGAPPRGRFSPWAPGQAALSLELVRVIAAAIDATDDAARFCRWAPYPAARRP